MDTPLDHMMKTFPSDKGRILKYCKQWHKGTEGHAQPWPKDGTFDHDIVEHTLTYIRSTYKKKKRQKREAILSLWRVFCHEKERDKSTTPKEAVTPIQEVAQTQTESPGNLLGKPQPYGLYPILPAAGYQDPVRVEPKKEKLEARELRQPPLLSLRPLELTQSNGIVERLNGLLKNKIRKLCVTMKKNWLYCLPLALYALRNQPGSDHHLTPYQIVTGRPMPTPLIIARQRTDAQKTAEVLGQEMSSYLSQLLKSVNFFSNQVARQEKCTNAAQQTSPISVGQQVYIRNFVRRWKDSKFEGPYLVTQSTPTAVKVEGRKPWIHLSDVRLSPASCHTSPSSQEHLQQDKDKDEGQRPS
ncbi:hypothetical protein NDU88_000453 [Pleurodeles waltl]|uniref:Murine leukemia virus integrase C-terminal domain-containing protein n=1 Tax=Pleurodeles waltl TaxID=8319 RepID=A0AAV7S8M9_PLEWA|nr:hypothetical protein NDU88_000453 [Pleurodeles waltl]